METIIGTMERKLMTVLIDREQAVSKLQEHKKLFCPDYGFSKLSKEEKARVDEIDNCIATIIDIIPAGLVKKGKWQRRKGADCWECSQCHAVLENDDLRMHNFYFCYHCGANMFNRSGYMDIEEVRYE